MVAMAMAMAMAMKTPERKADQGNVVTLEGHHCFGMAGLAICVQKRTTARFLHNWQCLFRKPFTGQKQREDESMAPDT